MDKSHLDLLPGHVISIPQCDRWQAYHRLQELSISCCCLGDGSFRVEIDNVLAVVQLRSVIHQLTTPRQQLVKQLERCWHL